MYRMTLGPTQPPIQWMPVAKQPGHDADHWPPLSAKMKYE
jgi:hypothetical protein